MASHPPPKKSLGQHFLTDRNILNAIADAADVGPDDTVAVGAGRSATNNVVRRKPTNINN